MKARRIAALAAGLIGSAGIFWLAAAPGSAAPEAQGPGASTTACCS